MVVWKSLCAGNWDLPVLQIQKKSPRIADATKCEEWARADFRGGKNWHACAKSAEPQQTCGGGKHGIPLKLANGRRSTRRGFRAREYEQRGAAHRGNRFAQTACGQERFVGEWLRGVHKQEVDVASELHVLVTIVEEKNIHALFFQKLPLLVAVCTHAK